MRPDMAKVLCEHPRGGRRGKRRSRIRRRSRWRAEDAPSFEPVSRRRGGTKHLSENLGPLKRWLIAQSGRPWDDVYSELRAHISARNVVQMHIWQHAQQYVARYVELVDGTPYHLPGDGRLSPGGRPVQARWCPVYVCPRTGIVRRTPVAARKKKPPPGSTDGSTSRDRIVLEPRAMARPSTDEIGKRLHESGRLAEFEKAIAGDDAMSVVMVLQELGVENEVISRMLLELDKEYLLALVDAGRAAAE